MKQYLAVVLTLVMVFTMIPPALLQAEGEEGGQASINAGTILAKAIASYDFSRFRKESEDALTDGSRYLKLEAVGKGKKPELAEDKTRGQVLSLMEQDYDDRGFVLLPSNPFAGKSVENGLTLSFWTKSKGNPADNRCLIDFEVAPDTLSSKAGTVAINQHYVYWNTTDQNKNFMDFKTNNLNLTPSNGWTMVTMVVTKDDIAFYRNNARIEHTRTAHYVLDYEQMIKDLVGAGGLVGDPADTKVRIGASLATYWNCAGAWIDDISFYDKALTAEEVALLYDETVLLSDDNNTYQIYDIGMTWDEAKAYCQSMGGHLAVITTPEEQRFIENLLNNGKKNSYWIGGYKDLNGKWSWVTGEAFEYYNWALDQPDDSDHSIDGEDAIMIYKNPNPFIQSGKGQWNDLYHDGTCGNESFFGVDNFGFICEWDEYGTGNIENISTSSNNNITVRVLGDINTSIYPPPIKDAAVSIENFGNVSTDEEGRAVLENVLTDKPLVNAKVSIKKEGYREYYFYKDIYCRDAELLWNSNDMVIYMKKMQEGDDINPYISTLSCQKPGGIDFDAMSSVTTYHAWGSEQRLKIQMNAVWNGKTPSKYILYQENGISYTSTDGKFELDMGEAFRGKYPIYAKLVASDGTTVVEKTGFQIKGGGDVVSASPGKGLDLIDTDSTGSLGEDVAFLSGQNVKIELKGIKMDVSVEEGKVKIAIGKEKKLSEGEYFSNKQWEDWKKLCEHQSKDLNMSQWKDVVERIDTNWTGNIKGETEVYGYLEGTVNENGDTILAGKLKLDTSLNAGIQSQYTIGVVPVYAKISVGASGSAEGALSYNWTQKSLDAENTGITLSLEPYLAAEGGVGVMAVATVGIEGKGSLPFSAKIGAGNDAKLSIKGGLSLKAKLLAFEYSLSLAEREWQLLPKVKTKSNMEMKGISVLSMDDFQLSDDSYTEEESIWLGEEKMQAFSLETTGKGLEERILKTNINPDADVQLIDTGKTKMLLWTDGDAGRKTINNSKLLYSVYQGENGTWSAPVAVADDGTADYAPTAVSDGEHIYVAWQNVSKKFSDDASLGEIAKASTIVMSAWTEESGFSDAEVISQENCMAVMPKIALNNEGKPYVAYLENTDNNLLLTTGKNRILYSVVNGSGIEQKIISENAGLVTAMDTCYTDRYEVGYTLDVDGDLSTVEDREIVQAGKGEYLTKNSCMDSNLQYVKSKGMPFQFWYQDGSIVMATMDGAKTVVYQDKTGALTDDFCVVSGKDGQLALTWTAVDLEGNKQIEGILYDSLEDKWSEPILISDTDANIYHPQGVFAEDGTLQFLYKKAKEEQTDLCFLMAEPSVNLIVENAYCDEALLVPGNFGKINVQIGNHGLKTADDFVVNIAGTQTAVAESIQPGESIVVEAEYRVPEDFRYQEITITVENSEGISSQDNPYILAVGHTDLAINLTSSTYALGQFIEAKVANENGADTEATLEIHKGEKEGELIKSIPLGKLAKGTMSTVTYLWNQETENYSEDTEALYFNIVSEQPEKYTDNNYDFVVIGKSEEEKIPSPGDSGIAVLTAVKEKTEYRVGDTLNLDDLVVAVKYADQTVRRVRNYVTNASEIDMMTEGKKALNITYEENNAIVHTAVEIEVKNSDLKKEYIITASCGVGGKIEPEGMVAIKGGESKTFIITPKDGYIIQDVEIDGKNMGAVSEYTFSDISNNHVIKAFFKKVGSGQKEKEDQSFTGTLSYSKTYGNASFKLDAVLAEGNGFLTYVSSNPKVAEVSEKGEVKITGAGNASITVTAAETEEYKKCEYQVSVNVAKASQRISGTAKYSKTVGSKPFRLDAKRTVGEGKISYFSVNCNVATVSGSGTVTIKKPGNTVITVTAAATANYNAYTFRINLSVAAPKKGTTLTDPKTKAKYKVTKQGKSVEYSKPKDKNVTKATIPATVTISGVKYNVTGIAANAFSGCRKLKSIGIGKNVESIGTKAFANCTALGKISIPSKVSKIGKQAFSGCGKLKEIKISSTKLTSKSIGAKAFQGIYAKATIKVPKAKKAAYQKLLKSKGIGKKVKIK